MLKYEVLKILLASSSHISGQTISNRLGVSRTAIWKAVNALKNEGYNIESVNNRGYLLLENKGILNRIEIEQRMDSYKYKTLPKVIYFNQIPPILMPRKQPTRLPRISLWWQIHKLSAKAGLAGVGLHPVQQAFL